jgi:hypothetical protein
MTGRVEAAARGYTELAASLAERWRDHLDAIQAQVEQPSYTANQAVADLASTAAVAVDSWLLLAWEAVDAAAILTAERPEASFVRSEEFHTSIPGATLTVIEPFVNVRKTDELRPGVIRCEPAELAPGQTAFRLSADVTLRRSGIYSGRVRAAGPGGTEVRRLEISVP